MRGTQGLPMSTRHGYSKILLHCSQQCGLFEHVFCISAEPPLENVPGKQDADARQKNAEQWQWLRKLQEEHDTPISDENRRRLEVELTFQPSYRSVSQLDLPKGARAPCQFDQSKAIMMAIERAIFSNLISPSPAGPIPASIPRGSTSCSIIVHTKVVRLAMNRGHSIRDATLVRG